MRLNIRKKEIIWEDSEHKYLMWFDVGALGKIKNLSFAKGNKGEDVLEEQKIIIYYTSYGVIKNILISIKLTVTQIWKWLCRLV